MQNPDRARLAGPLARHAEGFRCDLTRRGYRQGTVARQLRLMAHLSRWMEDQRLEADGLTPAVASAFAARRRADGHRVLASARALDPLLGYLAGRGVTPRAVPVEDLPAAERFLACYAGYLRGNAAWQRRPPTSTSISYARSSWDGSPPPTATHGN